MSCFTQNILTLRLSVGGRTDGRTDARTHARKIFTQYSGISSCSLGSTDINAECKRGYSRGEIVSETFVNKGTHRVVYQRRTKNDLLIVPYNLQMMMDWDSHINVEYSGSAYCALYL